MSPSSNGIGGSSQFYASAIPITGSLPSSNAGGGPLRPQSSSPVAAIALLAPFFSGIVTPYHIPVVYQSWFDWISYPSVQGTHLKDWRLLDLVRTEVWRRAIPWTRLMLAGTGLTDDLNVAMGERFRAALAAALLGGVVAAVWEPGLWWFPVALLGAVIGGNWELVRFFHHRKGLAFTAAALLFHQFYYLYSATAFAWTWLEHQGAKLIR